MNKKFGASFNGKNIEFWFKTYDEAVNHAEKSLKQYSINGEGPLYLIVEAVSEIRLEATYRTLINEFPKDN